MAGLLQDNLLEKDTGHDGIGMGGQEKKSKNEGGVLGVRKRCSGCNGPAS